MILDGEAVVLDDRGRSDFGLLQRALGKRPSLHESSEVVLMAFDLLYLDGHDLRPLPLLQRRRRLEPIVAGRNQNADHHRIAGRRCLRGDGRRLIADDHKDIAPSRI